jgi:hypothetical protein
MFSFQQLATYLSVLFLLAPLPALTNAVSAQERQIETGDRGRLVCNQLRRQFREQRCAEACTENCKSIGDALLRPQDQCVSREETQLITCKSDNGK